MTPDLNELLKKIASAKSVTLILIIVFLGIFVWRNLDFLTEISFTLRKSDTKTETTAKDTDKKASGVPQLSLENVVLPPAPKKLTSFAVFQTDNPGSAATKDVRVTVDFGAAKVLAYEVIGPKENEVSGSEPNQSVINLDIAQLRPHESAYIYAQTSHPGFKKISICSSNTIPVIEYSYGDYLAKTKSNGGGGLFYGFLLFLLGGFLLVMTVYFTIALIQILNRKLKVNP